MKPKLLLTIASIYLGLGELAALIAPAQNYNLDSGTSAYSLNILRSSTSLIIGVAVVYWFSRNAEASKARDALFLGSTVGFGLATIFLVAAALTPDGVLSTWVIAAIDLLFVIGFFVVGRANMSTNAS